MRTGKREKDRRADGENRLLPPVFFEIALILLVAFHFAVPSARIVHFPYRWGGVVCIVLGITINLWADRLFKKEQTTVKPNERPAVLVTSGPFRFSRHPMYWGMTLILLGAAVLSGSLCSFLFPILFMIVMLKAFIPLEEKNLEDAFGQEYVNYRNRVRF